MTSTTSPPPYTFPEAVPHGTIDEIVPNVYMVQGEIGMNMVGSLVRMTFSRNMFIIKQGKDDDLILVNSVRLSEQGLQELDKLGTVKHIIRLAAFHGMDDPFYQKHYNAKVWAVQGTTYFDKFETDGKPYFTPDEWMTAGDAHLPLSDASLTVIDSKPPHDGVLLLKHSQETILFTGDSLQNFEAADSYFNWLGSIAMRLMGFVRPCQVGPAWARASRVKKTELEQVLELRFDHVLPAHGKPVIDNAWKKYEASVQSMK